MHNVLNTIDYKIIGRNQVHGVEKNKHKQDRFRLAVQKVYKILDACSSGSDNFLYETYVLKSRFFVQVSLICRLSRYNLWSKNLVPITSNRGFTTQSFYEIYAVGAIAILVNIILYLNLRMQMKSSLIILVKSLFYFR